jgi:rubredoxin
MSREARIQFECPKCGATHDRGFVNGVDTFRCLACGYAGHGFHPDPEIDRGVFLDAQEANELQKKLGLPELWPWGPEIEGRP